MRITAINQCSPGRFTVCLDDGREIKATLGVVTELRLFSGKELEEEELEELARLAACALAREKALEYLSRRPMSQKELRAKLIQKGADEAVAEDCVRWLCEHRLLDDEGYAAAVARHYTAKGYGAGRIRAELSRRGIDRELWDGILEQLPGQDSKVDKFIAARLKDPSDREQVRKLSAALSRRGYSWEEIRAGLRRFHAEGEEY